MQWTGSMKHERDGVSDGKRAQLKRNRDGSRRSMSTRCLLSHRGCVSCTAIRCSTSLIRTHCPRIRTATSSHPQRCRSGSSASTPRVDCTRLQLVLVASMAPAPKPVSN